MSDHTYQLSDYPADEPLTTQKLRQRVGDDATLGALTLTGIRHHTKTIGGVTAGEVRYRFVESLDVPQVAALDALVAGHADETLAEAQERCIGESKLWRDAKLEQPGEAHGILVEWPAASGKKWPVTFADRQAWGQLEQNKGAWAYPMTRRTWNELDSHTFQNSAEVSQLHDDLRDAVMTEVDACDSALAVIVAAADIPAAEAARDAYLGA